MVRYWGKSDRACELAGQVDRRRTGSPHYKRLYSRAASTNNDGYGKFLIYQ